jgi:hypothetical protein
MLGGFYRWFKAFPDGIADHFSLLESVHPKFKSDFPAFKKIIREHYLTHIL